MKVCRFREISRGLAVDGRLFTSHSYLCQHSLSCQALCVSHISVVCLCFSALFERLSMAFTILLWKPTHRKRSACAHPLPIFSWFRRGSRYTTTPKKGSQRAPADEIGERTFYQYRNSYHTPPHLDAAAPLKFELSPCRNISQTLVGEVQPMQENIIHARVIGEAGRFLNGVATYEILRPYQEQI